MGIWHVALVWHSKPANAQPCALHVPGCEPDPIPAILGQQPFGLGFAKAFPQSKAPRGDGSC